MVDLSIYGITPFWSGGKTVKWFLIALAMASPCYAATLSGRVEAEDAGTVSDAKIVVYNEMAVFFVQRGKTDRNGNYLFTLSPGSYRIWVLKEGYQPDRAEALIIDRDQKFKLTHFIKAQPSQISATDKVKQLIRGQRNKNPFRELSQPEISIALLPEPDTSLAGAFSAHATQDLNGESGQRSTVEVAARLSERITLESKLTNEHRLQRETMEIEAGVNVKWGAMNVDIKAHAIQDPNSSELGNSRKLRLFGNYNDRFASHTTMSLLLSDNLAERSHEMHLSQDVSYKLGGYDLRHELNLSGWEYSDQASASEVKLSTDWNLSPFLGLKADVDMFSYDGDQLSDASFWLTGARQTTGEWLKIQSQVGVRTSEQDPELVQQHTIVADHGKLTIEAEYRQDAAFSAYNSVDVYGTFTPRPLTPFANESFFTQKDRQANLKLGLIHSSQWTSTLRMGHEESQASLIHSYRPDYKSEADYEAQTYAYMLSSHRWGSKIEVSHSKNATEDMAFDQTGVRYVQALNPFRNRGLGLQLELEMTSNPNLPAWWLLAETPWDPMENNTWYQGRLSLQF